MWVGIWQEDDNGPTGLRLQENRRRRPRTKDHLISIGSPKDLMAQDCNVSATIP